MKREIWVTPNYAVPRGSTVIERGEYAIVEHAGKFCIGELKDSRIGRELLRVLPSPGSLEIGEPDRT